MHYRLAESSSKVNVPVNLSYHLMRRRVAHDFFSPQPQTNASIFFLKEVLHDWSDKYSSKILKQLRDAATPSTKLVILEMIMRHACHDDTEGNTPGITSSVSIKAPNPLLPNWGAVNDIIYILDMVVRFFLVSHFPLCGCSMLKRQMLTMFNSQERTIRQFDQLFRSAGWKITEIRRRPRIDVHFLSSIIAVPI